MIESRVEEATEDELESGEGKGWNSGMPSRRIRCSFSVARVSPPSRNSAQDSMTTPRIIRMITNSYEINSKRVASPPRLSGLPYLTTHCLLSFSRRISLEVLEINEFGWARHRLGRALRSFRTRSCFVVLCTCTRGDCR